jgi:hypothetical protein
MKPSGNNLGIRTALSADEAGFGLAEFLISTVILLVISAGVFTLMADMQSSAGYQSEVQGVLGNSRIGMEMIEHYILQAGNNPRSAVLTPVTITSSTEVRLQSDLTGSSGGGQGDPDGDIADPDEDVIIRYNSTDKTIELVLADGTVQTIASYISAFSFTYLDATGAVTATANDVRMIRVAISGASTRSNPRTHKTFGIALASDFKLQNLL